MKKLSVRSMINSRALKYGGYATLFTVAVLAALVIVNLIVQQIPAQVDLTSNKLFSLSDQTKKVIASIDKPVTIYGMFVTGNEPTQLMEIIRKYEQSSKFITFKVVDPEANPGTAAKYAKTKGESLSNGSIVVESGSVFKAVDYYEMLNVSYQDPNNPQVQSLAFEQRITNALLYAASGSTPKIYRLTGHSEYSLADLQVQTQVENVNFTVEDLSLVTEPAVPADAQLVAVISPKIDFSEQEAEKLRTYIDAAGHALFLLDFNPGVNFPVLNSLLQSYGIQYNNKSIVMEGRQDRYYRSQFGINPFWVIPEMLPHEITTPISSSELILLVPESASLQPTELKRRTLEVTPVLRTSDRSWIRKEYQSESYERIATDTPGPVALAFAVSGQPSQVDEKTLRVMVVGSSQFLSPKLNMGMIPGNVNFFINALSWTADKTDSISIQPRSLFVMPMQLNAQEMAIFAGIFTLLIPLIILGAGVVVWLRRRHL